MSIRPERVVLIRPVRLYRQGMTHDRLYEITRQEWRTNPNRHNPEYASRSSAAWFSPFFGSTGGSAETLPAAGYSRVPLIRRWSVVMLGPRDRYFAPGAANPVRYINC